MRLGGPVVEGDFHRAQAQADRRYGHRTRQDAQADDRRLDAGLAGPVHGSSARYGLPGQRPLSGGDEDVGARGQVGIEARAVPDQAVGVADLELVADLDVADDAACQSPAICTAITSTPSGVRMSTLLRSLSSLAAPARRRGTCRGDALPQPPRHRRGALHVGVEQRQEDADAGQRRCGQAEFSRRRRFVDEAYQPVGGRDDNTGTCRRHPGWVPEERGVGSGGGEPDIARPNASCARRGDRRLAPTNGKPAGCMGGTDRAHQRREPRRACLEIGASGHRVAILRVGTQRIAKPGPRRGPVSLPPPR